MLGCLLLDADVRLECDVHLTAECFEDLRHRTLFSAIEALAEENHFVTFPMVLDWLRDRGRLSEVGGEAYLRHLVQLVPSVEVYPHHASRVRDAWLRRRVWLAALAAQEAAVDLSRPVHDALGLLEDATACVAGEALSGAVSLGEAVDSRWREIVSNETQAREGIRTRYQDLESLDVRLRPGELVVIAGRPSHGKTQFAINLARQAAEVAPVWFFSLETSARTLADRFLGLEMGLPLREIRDRARRDSGWILGQEGHVAKLKNLPIWIVDKPAITTAEIAAYCHRARRTTGLGLVIVDYLTLLGDSRLPAWSRDEYVGLLATRMQDLARRLDVSVICLSQLSRAVEHRADKRPTLADLRESGMIEAAAHLVILLHRPEAYDPKPENQNLLVAEVAKQKDGPTGTVRFTFLKDRGGLISSCEDGAGTLPEGELFF